MVDQRLRLGDELFGIHLFVRDIAAQPHQLLLAFEQAQAKALLGIFDILLDGLLLTVDFLNAQVTESRHHSGQKQRHRQQGAQRDESVLPGGRLFAPPVPPPRQ